MSRLSKKVLLRNSNCRWGLIILSLYLLWFFSWLVYRYFIEGTPSHPYTPQIHLPPRASSPSLPRGPPGNRRLWTFCL